MRISVNFPRTFDISYEAIELKALGFDILHTRFGVTLTFPEGWTVVDFFQFFDEDGAKRGFITHDDGGCLYLFPRFSICKLHGFDLENIGTHNHDNVLAVYDAKYGKEPIFVTEDNDDYFDSVRAARDWLINYIEAQGMSYDRSLEPDFSTQFGKEFYFFCYTQNDPLLNDVFKFW